MYFLIYFNFICIVSVFSTIQIHHILQFSIYYQDIYCFVRELNLTPAIVGNPIKLNAAKAAGTKLASYNAIPTWHESDRIAIELSHFYWRPISFDINSFRVNAINFHNWTLWFQILFRTLLVMDFIGCNYGCSFTPACVLGGKQRVSRFVIT